MMAVRHSGSVRLARWVLIPSALAVSLLGLAAPAGASGSASVAAATLAKVVSVAGDSNSDSYCALLSTGGVDCWGDNDFGQLGDGTTTSSDVPVAAIGIGKARAVATDVYGESFCALLATGHVDCWGLGTSGELGDGATENSDVPAAVKNISTATTVTGGAFGFCAVLSTGQVHCWGFGADGDLGDGHWISSDVPVAVRGISNATVVTGGEYDGDGGTFCALLSTGRVDCWGNGYQGELGNGTTKDSDVPVAAQTISNATAVTSDGNGGSFCALLSTGGVDCWGYNFSGQLGDGTTTNSNVPVAAVGISTATAVTGGEYGLFCAVLSTGHVDCWGYNYYGQLGDGSTKYSDVPVAVKYISAATAVTGGEDDACAVLSTGHVDCWGFGEYGDLGNGTFNDSDIPVYVHAITNAAAVTAGDDGFCALLSTGHPTCWGYNAYGELGNGTTADSDVPVAVLAAGHGAAWRGDEE
jgi:alpha-tubulin suppressor-like RCC1 family protein